LIYILDVLWNTVHCIVYLPVVYCCVCVCVPIMKSWFVVDNQQTTADRCASLNRRYFQCWNGQLWSIRTATYLSVTISLIVYRKTEWFHTEQRNKLFLLFSLFLRGFCTFFLVYIVELVSCPSTIRWDVPDVVFAVFYLLNNIGASSLGRIHIKLAVTDLPFFDRYSVLFLFLFDFPHFLH
jgi:hypothetical protein